MPINPSYQNQPMFNNPYGGTSAPSMPSGGGGGGGGGWLQNAAMGGLSGGMMGGPVGAAVGVGGSLLTGLLGSILGGDSEQEELFKMQIKEAARVRKQRKGEMGAGQSRYQQRAGELFPEMPRDAFTYKNPVLDNAITNALMYRMGNMFSDWGMPEGRRAGGQDLRQQFLGGMNFANPYGAPPSAPAPMPQPDVTVPPRGPEQGGWMGEFRGGERRGRGRRGEYDRFAM